MHAKGMEVGGYDPRGAKGMALVYGCGPRGGCHHAGGYTVTAELTNPEVDRFADSGKAPIALGSTQPPRRRRGLRRHVRLPVDRHAGRHAGPGRSRRPPVRSSDQPTSTSPVSASTRWSASSTSGRACGPWTTSLPRRLCDEALTEGPLAGQTVDFDLMRSEFYQASGLDPDTTLPTAETLARLGLEWVAEDPTVAEIMKQGAQ